MSRLPNPYRIFWGERLIVEKYQPETWGLAKGDLLQLETDSDAAPAASHVFQIVRFFDTEPSGGGGSSFDHPPLNSIEVRPYLRLVETGIPGEVSAGVHQSRKNVSPPSENL